MKISVMEKPEIERLELPMGPNDPKTMVDGYCLDGICV